MEGGTVNIKGVEDDGVQVELSSDPQTGQTSGHEDENSGNASTWRTARSTLLCWTMVAST